VRGDGRQTFLSEISMSSFASNPFLICFAEIVCRSPEARMPSMIAEYCARSAGSKGTVQSQLAIQ
jgi:hypothetical protein